MLDVRLVAATAFAGESALTDAEAAVEYAARLTGSSQAAAPLLRELIDSGRVGFLDHASATLHVTGISRDAARVVLAHPGFAVQERTRLSTIPPAAIEHHDDLRQLFESAVEEAHFVHDELLRAIEESLSGEPNVLARRKRAEEAAGALLPGALECELVVTGTYRAWREFLQAHNGEFEHPEVKEFVAATRTVLQDQAPLLMEDL